MRTVDPSSTVYHDMTVGTAAPAVSGTLAASTPSVAHSTAEAAADLRQQQIRLALRVVVHLSRLGPLEPGSTAQPESTQQGMASRLQVTQGAVSKVLRQLGAADVVRHARHHVQGGERRMRAYFLTARGLDLARRYRERVPDSPLLA
jgi:DNA-binding MarR family transcriptional regulator